MASQIADRNLLFGVLALQMEFVTQEQVVAGLDAWGHSKEKTLGDILVEQRVLDAERRQLLDAVLLQRLKQHGGDPGRNLAALAVPPALREQLSRIVDPDLQASVSRMPAPEADPYATNYGVGGVKTQPEIALPPDPYSTNVGAPAGATQPEPAKAADPYATNLPSVGGPGGATRADVVGGATTGPSGRTVGRSAPTGSRFRVLRPHARGGLGEVLLAEDEEVRREVALKQIQTPHADDLDSRARFLAEAEITGALEHPGIVPVYGLGQYADGRPYYAMRFIRGDSLKEAIDRYHKSDGSPRDASERNLQLRHLLERFIDVCEAIAYAHSRGILHRDLKPGNIMLGKYGETLVVDWGLAKPIDEKEKIPENPDQKRVTLSGTALSSPTLMGSAVGTPQFMSPEQAAGDLDKLGPASDVYSMGATLYALLTGSVPIVERDLVSLLQRVQKGDFPPPRAIKADVPRAMEAICLKAMALKPQDRYAGTKELAKDIERWLGDEPVSAYPEPWPARLARTMRKNPAIVAASAVFALACLVVAIVLNVYKEKERKAKEEALRNYQLAREAVDRYDTNVSESVLLNEPGMQPLRKQLLADAQDFYVKFVKNYREDDPTVIGELARAKYRLGQITGVIESEKEAIKILQEAAKVFAVDKTVDATEVARCYYHLGWMYRLTDKFDESVEWYQKALVIWESLGGANEDQLAGWARSCLGLGNVLQQRRQFEKARTEYDKALATLEKLDEHLRSNKRVHKPEYLRDKGLTHRNLGMVYSALGEKDADARAEFAKAIAQQEGLAKDHPNVSKFQDDLASSHFTLGFVHFRNSRIADSLKEDQIAIKIWQQLTVTHPAVLEYHARLADGYAALAGAHSAAHETEKAIKTSQEALDVQKHLADKCRELAYKNEAPKYRALLGRRYVQHADVLRRATLNGETNYQKQAVTAYQEALKIQKELTAEVPETSDYKADLARTHHGLGLLYIDQKQPALAEAEFNRALEIWQKLQSDYPESAEFAEGMAATLMNLRAVTRSSGNVGISLAPLDRIIDVYAAYVLNHPQPALQRALFHAHWSRAEARTAHGRFAEALLDWERAEELAKGTTWPTRDADYSWVCVYRTVTLAQYGECEKATTEAAKLLDAFPKNPEVHYQLARTYAFAAAKAAAKIDGNIEQAKKNAELYAERSVELLEQARGGGFFKQMDHRLRLATDPDWQFLRSRTSFQALLKNLQ